MAVNDNDCERCRKHFDAGDRRGVRPEPAWIRARCPACNKQFYLCRLHYPTWVACSTECKAEWKKMAAEGLPKERMTAPNGAKPRKPRGAAVHQKDMFAGNG